MQKRMKATRSFRYATRMLQAGEEFDATRQDARVLSAIGRAQEVDVAPVVDDEDEAVEAEPVKRRGRKAKSGD